MGVSEAQPERPAVGRSLATPPECDDAVVVAADVACAHAVATARGWAYGKAATGVLAGFFEAAADL